MADQSRKSAEEMTQEELNVESSSVESTGFHLVDDAASFVGDVRGSVPYPGGGFFRYYHPGFYNQGYYFGAEVVVLSYIRSYPYLMPRLQQARYPSYYPQGTLCVSGQYVGPDVYPQGLIFRQPVAMGYYSRDSSLTTQDGSYVNDSNEMAGTPSTRPNSAFQTHTFGLVSESPPQPENKAPICGSSVPTNSLIMMDRYKFPDFTTRYDHAFFFVIKSFNGENIHKAIKYNVWSSSHRGNKKLNRAYQEAGKLGGNCPVFLFFSVNHSYKFCGVAEMTGPVDYDKQSDFWHRSNWRACFPVKWHIIKDLPFRELKRIKNINGSPVKESRDTDELEFLQGFNMLKIFKDYEAETSIFNDFETYERLEHVMQKERTKPSSSRSDMQHEDVDELSVADPRNIQREEQVADQE